MFSIRTLCPLSPGRPGSPSKPLSPCKKDRDPWARWTNSLFKHALQQHTSLAKQNSCSFTMSYALLRTHERTGASCDYGAEVCVACGRVWQAASEEPSHLLRFSARIRCWDSESCGSTSHFLIKHAAVVLNSSAWFIYWRVLQLDRAECLLLSAHTIKHSSQ